MKTTITSIIPVFWSKDDNTRLAQQLEYLESLKGDDRFLYEIFPTSCLPDKKIWIGEASFADIDESIPSSHPMDMIDDVWHIKVIQPTDRYFAAHDVLVNVDRSDLYSVLRLVLLEVKKKSKFNGLTPRIDARLLSECSQLMKSTNPLNN